MAQALSQPHSTSYFLPGKVERRPIQFLLNTGCTMNLLNKQVFDRLPEAVRDQLKESDSHGLLANGRRHPFYGIIRLTVRLRDVRTEEVFVVSSLSKDVILGTPFFVVHQCFLEFEQPVVRLDGRQLVCMDRHG
ncbi:retroviral-like aspartic protease 1 [Watersipora subatra]|uniref:retroviral-like aspartic protease 1 n=1 Tax=Watersipora subatra TaxID=2589382 RepID=UPI00355B10BC